MRVVAVVHTLEAMLASLNKYYELDHEDFLPQLCDCAKRTIDRNRILIEKCVMQ